MKKILLSIILLTSIVLFTNNTTNSIHKFDTKIALQQSYVLICASENAYAYHTHYCQGLKRCKKKVYKVSKQEAINNNYRACGYCY